MSELTDKIAAEHASTSGIGCVCGHRPGYNERINDARTRHLIAVTERAVRAQVAADIRAWVAEQEDGVLTSGPHSSGVRYAAAACEGIAEGSAD